MATVTGTISDATGAVVANAPITLRNIENGQTFSAASSETGNFTVSQLPIGDYDLTVAVPGFKTYTHTKFHLAAAQTMREDVLLEVGQTSESVTVTAEASLLRTEGSELVHNVTLSQMNNLPILPVGSTNSGFRDPFASTRLVPGIRYSTAALATESIIINGTPSNTLQTRLDGATINPTSPRLLGATMQTQPSVDAIEEVAIQTSNFAAEYGTAGGAVVNMVSKSGTNQFHGTAYDYFVNEALNARQPYTGLRNKVRQQDWGFTFGGPVRIPKVYDGKNKTFFFWSYEQFRQKSINSTSASTVPIAPYRIGDFSNVILQENRLVTTASGPVKDPLGNNIPSGTIYDPATGSSTRTAFPGNQIPVTRFDPIAAKVLNLVPQPLGVNAGKGQAGNNYQAPYDTSRTSAIPSIKIDHNLSSKGRLSFYFQRTSTDTPRTVTGADNFPSLITAGVRSVSSGRTFRLNYDHTLTPLLLLHFGVGFNDSDFNLSSDVINYDSFKELGLTGQTLARNFPRIAMGAIPTGSSLDALGGMSSLGTTTQQHFWERRPSGNASATYVKGAHTYKVGAEYRLEKFPNTDFSNTNGVYTFGFNWTQQPSLQNVTTNQGFTGFPLASFLLGGMSGASQFSPIAAGNSKSQTAIYIQDTWKATRKLTLDYGIRWDYGTYTKEQYGRNGSFGAAVSNPSASGILGGRQYESTCKCNFASNYPWALGPRLGVAYQINSKTVIRGGFGVVYNATSTAAGSSTNSAAASTPATNSGQIVGLFKDGIPSDVRSMWPNVAPNAGQPVGAVVGFPNYVDPNAGRPARLLQWNVTVQREINRDLVVEAAYVGNRGVWWTANDLNTMDFLQQSVLTSRGFNDFTSLAESQLLTATVDRLTPAQRATLAARGITGIPYANFPTATQTVRQSLLPFPQYTSPATGILQVVGGAPLGKTWYDSFQLTLNKRFSHGLTLNFNYNYSKNLDLMSATDVFNRDTGKNLSVNDLPHQLRLTAQYVVPNLRNSGFRAVSNKYVSAALSGWGLGTYLNYQSAALVGLPTSAGAVPLSQFLGRGPGPAQLMPGANPWSVDWTDYDGNHHSDPLDINCHCFDPTKTVVLNPNVWTNVPDGQWAANMSSIRSFRGFRAPTENANFSRNFRFGRDGRYNLNLRIEFANIFNRMQYSSLTTPITLGNFKTAPTKFQSGNFTGLYSGGYGTVVPTAGTSGQRSGTLIGRFTF
ncbi:MAG: TonB-dependent receptor [Acidobacteriota bacterium]